MKLVHTIDGVRSTVAAWKHKGETIALVPTMGNLHSGHLQLVKTAREHHSKVIVSVFVNPLQFGPDEDFDSYPRTLDADASALEGESADLVFAPSATEMYPIDDSGKSEPHVEVKLPSLANLLCGEHRPGHFDGVGTVVLKLFNIVQPHSALFGEKDFQQLLLIKIITRQLNLPINVQGVPTVRADDGLALSSRNQYLTDAERETAPTLQRTLHTIATQLAQGNTNYTELVAAGISTLRDAGFEPDYIEIRNADSLAEPQATTTNLRILAAARLGAARLIDNIGASRP